MIRRGVYLLLVCCLGLSTCSRNDLSSTPDGSAAGGHDAGGVDDDAVTSVPGFSSAWAEFMTPTDVADVLPLLQGRDVAISMAWEVDQIGDPGLAQMVRDAATAGVEVRPWLLLSHEDGYWPGSTNAATFAASARLLMDQWEADGLEPTTLLVDMEMRIDRATELQELLTADIPNMFAIIALLKEGVDEAQFEQAREIYAAMTDEAQARGWRVALTTLPQMLDDYEDGDDQMRQAFGIPIDGIDWDVMTFQAYRTLFGDLQVGINKEPLTSYFVYDHAVLALELFGDRAGVDIGMVAAGVTESSTYADGQDLSADVEAALAAGVPRERINVYNLDGIVERSPSDAWLAAPTLSPAAPPEDGGTESSHTTNKILDLLL